MALGQKGRSLFILFFVGLLAPLGPQNSENHNRHPEGAPSPFPCMNPSRRKLASYVLLRVQKWPCRAYFMATCSNRTVLSVATIPVNRTCQIGRSPPMGWLYRFPCSDSGGLNRQPFLWIDNINEYSLLRARVVSAFGRIDCCTGDASGPGCSNRTTSPQVLKILRTRF